MQYMKSTKVQTLGAVTLLATEACTNDAYIVGLCPLQCHSLVSCLIFACTKVQTLGTVALHATTACTNDRSIVATQLGYRLVSSLGLHAVWPVHVCVCTCYSYSLVHACAYVGTIALAVRT